MTYSSKDVNLTFNAMLSVPLNQSNFSATNSFCTKIAEPPPFLSPSLSSLNILKFGMETSASHISLFKCVSVIPKIPMFFSLTRVEISEILFGSEFALE